MRVVYIRILSIAATIFIGGAFFYPSAVQAFMVSPTVVNLEIDPGATTQGVLHVTNTNEQRMVFETLVQNFVSRGENGQQDFLPIEDRSGLAAWLVPQAQSISLGAKESRDFSYTIRVPRDAEPGGHYAALFFSTKPTGSSGQSSVGVTARTGILFLLRVPGDIREDARIESFHATVPWNNRLPETFELRIRNLGNVHFWPDGKIVIKNIFGQEVAEPILNPHAIAVLPNSVRRIDSFWPQDPGERREGFFPAVAQEWKNFAFGYYTADLVGFYGLRRQPLVARTSFWILPWHLLLLSFVVFVVLLFAIRRYHRSVVRKAMKKMSGRS